MATVAAPRRQPRTGEVAAQVALPLLLIAAWQVTAMLAGDFYVATPGQAVDALSDGVSAGWFFESLGATLAATGVGFAIAAAVGLWIGVTLGLVRFWGDVFEPVALSVYSIPKVTLFPIFLTAFGFGLYSKVAIGMFHGIFPILVITMNATREVSPVHLKVARSLRLALGGVPHGGLPVDLPGGPHRPAAGLQPHAAGRDPGRDVRVARRLRL